MIRAAAVSGLRQRGMLFAAKSSSPSSQLLLTSLVPHNRNAISSPRVPVWRALSSSSSEGKKQSPPKGDEEEMTQEIVLTPGEKVVAGTRLTMWAAAAVFASFCAYYIGKELIPTKMSPNRVFDHAFDVVKQNSEVKSRFGEPLKAYGRDHGGHREGRRNFVENTEWVNEDGDKRTRVRFNLEGRFGKAFVFAERSKSMPSGEFVYVLVQDKQSGRVITVIDNRAALAAQKMAGNYSAEGQKAFADLLKGGGSK